MFNASKFARIENRLDLLSDRGYAAHKMGTENTNQLSTLQSHVNFLLEELDTTRKRFEALEAYLGVKISVGAAFVAVKAAKPKRSRQTRG
jgi:hypothetical protein